MMNQALLYTEHRCTQKL